MKCLGCYYPRISRIRPQTNAAIFYCTGNGNFKCFVALQVQDTISACIIFPVILMAILSFNKEEKNVAEKFQSLNFSLQHFENCMPKNRL